MKFLIQIPQLIFGGAEKVLVSFSNELVARGHEVEILETYEKGLLKTQFDPRVTFHAICSKQYTEKYYASLADIIQEKSIPKKLQKCVKKIFSMVVGYQKFAKKLAKKHYKDLQFDVAINYLEIESPEFICTSIRANKYLQWYHTDVANLDHPEHTDQMIPWYKKMDGIICVAQAAKESFIGRYPVLADKTHVIYNFYDVKAIQKAAEEKFEYQKINSDNITLLSVGRMTPQKKYLRFLEVLSQLKHDGFHFEWHVVGTGMERKQIEEKVRQLQLENYVILEGTTENPYQYMRHCDLFVLPSGWEGFPTVTVEAKILKCAVLATDVSGIKEQLIHGVTGWIVENSTEGLYKGLKHLLSHPEQIKYLRQDCGMERICDNNIKYGEVMKICGERE
ncbi:hypothetical protein B5G06_11805 [Flavonifractor sp. An52]|uniref:glycosyltransferase n=1 Tax=Flavonifractor sp. An52 TaxID=1965642 RepID=UPI000B37212B|nr:glycosyltransferase [Flavonifractor sp. An52]OUN80294.1 hypothetical protein B5G06_11805 [Flavonifractor sp. An52]